MGPAMRRQAILKYLTQMDAAISARKMAEKFDVSRQVIVGDIALLRAEGHDVLSTPRGYILPAKADEKSFYEGKVVCLHTPQQAEEELQIIVDNGGRVMDVSVDHPYYGLLTGKLQIATRYDIKEFLNHVKKHEAKMLSSLTDGVHTHVIHCPDQDTFTRIKSELHQHGILYI
ncbi:transcription repressor NadR [Jeotgalibaca porci]|uniref:transcription repressor NadR n=1 Tax=Jeotgalibaca porci TaxID=1868793 RepID=UPI0035A004EE